MSYDPVPPFRRDFDAARDPYTARNALGIPEPTGGGGPPAPASAEYVTASADATLTNERVLTNTASITWDFSTPGQAKANTAGGGGNVSNSGTPAATQYARWVTSTTIEGRTPAQVLSDIGAQPAGSYQAQDADLASIAGYGGTGTWLYRSAADTWSAVSLGGRLTFSGGTLNATDQVTGVAQPLDATLTALAAFNTNGLLTQTAPDTFTGRTLTAPAAGITISNGNGVAGNPTLALANDLAALEALAGTNTIYYRSGSDAWSGVTIGSGLAFAGGTLSSTSTTDTTEFHHGQLKYASATALEFKPFNGNKIKIFGTLYTIPTSGIAGLGNTGVFVNGASGASLAANTTYWVFAFINGGTVTGYFWNAAGGLTTPFHRPSIATGNEGTEVWFDGTTEVNTYTLIGMCRTNASSQFVDTTAVRGVLSWFNRRPRVAQGKFTADRSTASTSAVQINSEIDIGFLTWAEASVLFGTAGSSWNSGIATGRTLIYLDGAQLDGVAISLSPTAAYEASIGMTAAYGGLTAVTEGYHTATLYGLTTAGTQTWGGAAATQRCTLTAQIWG